MTNANVTVPVDVREVIRDEARRRVIRHADEIGRQDVDSYFDDPLALSELRGAIDTLDAIEADKPVHRLFLADLARTAAEQLAYFLGDDRVDVTPAGFAKLVQQGQLGERLASIAEEYRAVAA